MSDQASNIIFGGTPEFAAVILKALLESNHPIKAVYTQADKPAGRGRQLRPSPVKTLALEHDLPVYTPRSLREPDAQATFKALRPDLFIVVAYGLILPQAILDTPKHGCINIHASILPRWRGAAPIQRAIEAGDTRTGISIMQMEAGLDTGPVGVVQACDIHPTDTSASLHDKLATIAMSSLFEALKKIDAGTFSTSPQDHQAAIYAHKIDKAEGNIDWAQAAAQLERRARAFYPHPGVFSYLQGERIKILSAHHSDTHASEAPGTIVASDQDVISVATGDGLLHIAELQLPGGKPQTYKAIKNARAQMFAPGQQFVRQ